MSAVLGVTVCACLWVSAGAALGVCLWGVCAVVIGALLSIKTRVYNDFIM